MGSDNGYVYALNTKGKLLWKFKTGHWIKAFSIGDIDGDGEMGVVVGSDDTNIYALSGKTGELLWKFKTGDWVRSSPAIGDIDGDGKVDIAVASWDGYLYLFESRAKSGRVLWSRWHGDGCGTGALWNAISFAETNLKGKDYAFKWSPAPAGYGISTKPPYLVISRLMLIDEDRDKLFEAGERANLSITIENRGKGPAYGIKLKISGLVTKELLIGRIDPKKRITKRFAFQVPAQVKTKKERIKVFVDAGKYSPPERIIRFATRSAIPPRFYVRVRVDDDMSGESLGNGNGIIEPRETIELRVSVKNTGKGFAKGVVVRAKAEGKGISIIKGKAKLGNIPPGSKEEGTIVIFVPADYRNKNLPLKLKITEAYGLWHLARTINFSVQQKGMQVVSVSPEYGFSSEPEMTGFTGTIEVEETEEESCIPADPTAYAFIVGVSRYKHVDSLLYVENDIKLMEHICRCYLGVSKKRIKILKDVTKADLLGSLKDEILRIRIKHPRIYFYYSGHGLTDANGRYYIMPQDADAHSHIRLKESAVSLDSVLNILNTRPSVKIVMLDACRVKAKWKPVIPTYPSNLKNGVIIFGTRYRQISNIARKEKASAFTYSLYSLLKSTKQLSIIDENNTGWIEPDELVDKVNRLLRKVSASPNQRATFKGNKRIGIIRVLE